jgi:uncharacterized repeat protein (TIGR01451 family)
MKRIRIFFTFLFLFPVLLSAGNLTVEIFSGETMFGAAPGDSVNYIISYRHQGTDAASNVQVKLALPKALTFLSSYPAYSQAADSTYTFQLGTLTGAKSGMIILTGKISTAAAIGSVLRASAVISGTTSNDPIDDNTATLDLSVSSGGPDLWVFNWGLLEELESGNILTAEQNIQTNFEFTYLNFSKSPAQDARLIDTLPLGLEYVSAVPAPFSTSGNILIWKLGTIAGFGNGKISVVLKPTKTGSVRNPVVAVSSNADSNPDNNSGVFTFDVKALLQPRIIKPYVKYGGEDTMMLGKNPTFSGLAKAGATVAFYEGDSLGTFGDFSQLHPKLIGSAVAGSDRKWQIKTTAMTEAKIYYLYARAEMNGQASAPFFDIWEPMMIRVEPMIDLSGFDLDNFAVQSGDNIVHPGALGTTSGTVPDVDITITKRLNAPTSILTDHSLWGHHLMKLRITENDITREEDWPVTRVELPPNGKVGTREANAIQGTNFIYVHKGFGPGAKIEVWCLPVYYDSNGQLALVGLVYVKCHEILIDPAGYVYDKDIAGSTYDWPDVPPAKSLIKNATVTCLTRTGDNTFVKWDAAATGQVNPQVTDSLTNDRILINGYFAFYVPSGQYQINATAPEYIEYVSPVLTVIDEPVFHNVGMTHAPGKTATAVKWPAEHAVVPSLIELEQNYPNPFNPTTTIGYYLPRAMTVRLTVFDVAGREVAVLINNETRAAGRHQLTLDASRMPSGLYFYRLSSDGVSDVKKFVVVK